MFENIEISENGNGVMNLGFYIDNEDEKKVFGLILFLQVMVVYVCDVFVDDIIFMRVVWNLLR